jgi:hypothetical protein
VQGYWSPDLQDLMPIRLTYTPWSCAKCAFADGRTACNRFGPDLAHSGLPAAERSQGSRQAHGGFSSHETPNPIHPAEGPARPVGLQDREYLARPRQYERVADASSASQATKVDMNGVTTSSP